MNMLIPNQVRISSFIMNNELQYFLHILDCKTKVSLKRTSESVVHSTRPQVSESIMKSLYYK